MTARLILASMLGLAVIAPADRAHAAATDFIVQLATTGGTPENSKPYLDQFVAYAQGVLTGWKPIAMTFFVEPKKADAAIVEKKPGFGMIDPELFFEVKKREELVVLATVEGPMFNHGHLHVVVKDPAIKTLEDLKGKVLISHRIQSPRYVSKIVFDGKLDAEKHFALKPTTTAMRAFKAVDRGDASAALVDDAELANMKSLPFGATLRTVFTSAALPPTPFVAFGKNASPEQREAVKKMVLGMCGNPKGAEVCKSFQVTKFSQPDAQVFNEAMRRFDK